MADMNTKKPQARYKKDYEKHVRFKPCFAASDYAFVKRPKLMASAANRIACEGLIKLLMRHTGPYRAIIS